MATRAQTAGHGLSPFDPTAPLRPSGNLRRRLIVSGTVQGLAMLAAAIAVAALALITIEVVVRGAGVINWSFLTTNPDPSGLDGGIGANIIGSAVLVGVGAVIAIPLGVLCAIYLVEFASPRSRPAKVLQSGLDMMQGMPTVVIGLFIFGIVSHRTSGIAASLALSMIMLPLIARASQEVLLTVPGSLREAADALGVDRWRSILKVILPTALAGIVTGSIVALARAAGETAPLLVLDNNFVNSQTQLNLFGHNIPNIPMTIYSSADSSSPDALSRLWGISLVLLGLILIANFSARLVLWRSNRKMGR